MKKGFTLLELIVVVIILGILGTLGFTQYVKIVEKGRTAEAKTILGDLRTAEESYYLDYNAYTTVIAALPIHVAPSGACLTTHYFSYTVGTGGVTFAATATRCSAGGKTPNYVGAGYTIGVNQPGQWSGTAGYF